MSNPPPKKTSNAYCPDCQKVAYDSRSDAKRVIKFRFTNEASEMQAYRCPVDRYSIGWFHIGHKFGMTREEHRAKSRAV